MEKEDRSPDTRKGLFCDPVRTFADHPFGIGPECFASYQAAAGRHPQPTHYFYTQILAETGLQSMVGFLGLVSAILRMAFKHRRRLQTLVTDLTRARDRPQSKRAKMISDELLDARFLLASVSAEIVSVLLRLCIGIFRHDLFELCWWLAAGLTIALHNVLPIGEARGCDSMNDESSPPLHS